MSRSTPPRRQPRGRSLMELMVALIIGLVVLAAVMMVSIGSRGTNQRQDVAATINEDAQIASNLLTWHLRTAGYSKIMFDDAVAMDGSSGPLKKYMGLAVRGCDGGVQSSSATLNTMACAGGTGPDAFMVVYEATASNTVPTTTAPGQPTDCLGRTITATATSAAPTGKPADDIFALAENLFFISNNELRCAGNGGDGTRSSQPLLANVVDMQVRYGIAQVPQAGDLDIIQEAPQFEPIRYLTATEVSQLPPYPATETAITGTWNRVVSMRVCLVLSSPTETYDSPTPYSGCDGASVTPPDRKAYRAVTINTSLKNKAAPCADIQAAASGAIPSPDRCFF